MNVSEKNEQAFGVVLDAISKSALCLLNKSEHESACRIILGENDPTSIFVMGRILVGIIDQESDRKIASGISEILSASALPLADSYIKSIVAEVRDRCATQLHCLRDAHTEIENGRSVEDVLAHILKLI